MAGRKRLCQLPSLPGLAHHAQHPDALDAQPRAGARYMTVSCRLRRGDAAQDFMWGAAFAGAGGTASALAGRSGAQAFPCPPPGGTAGTPNLPWTSWNNYTKMTAANGQEYALIGGRLYSRHAVDRMQPSWLRFNARPGPDEGGSVGGMPQLRQTGGSYDYGRGVSPNWVEYVIRNSPGVPQDNGNLSHVLGTLQVIVSPEGRVVTVITH
ncbi:hypothetical protein AB0F95_08515 [Micromonospora tulbaghiae]|uniref:hypothetical protein n=1 Tax=Micromonospora tulbaghiae TaxID=479978 RepID=UPI0033DC1827